MLAFYLLTLMGSAMGGGLINPYLGSAGVTYSSYSTAHGPLAYKALAASSPLTAAPVAAPVGVATYATAPIAARTYAAAPFTTYASSPVATYAAAAPIATRAYAAAPLATYAAAAPIAAAPIATRAYAAAPVATYAAAAPLVAPASAVVPVTRISAQPAVVQNVVDVAHPKVATRRYEIRRPAIQKQFYDIEERIVVRPAGSAVVELETPISAGQRGATKVSPALHLGQHLGIRGYNPVHGLHVTSPLLAGYLPHQVSYVPAPSVHEPAEDAEQNQQQQPPQDQQQFAPQPQPQPIPQPAESQPEFDNSDSVSIENPEFARSGAQERISQNIQQPLFRSNPPQQEQPSESQARGDVQSSQSLERSEPQQQQFTQFQQFAQPQYFQTSGISQIQDIQALFRNQFLQQQEQQQQAQDQQQQEQQQQAESPREQQPDLSLTRSQKPLLNPRPEVSPRQGPTSQPHAEIRITQEADSRSYENADVIPSVRNLSPEQSQLNQQRLIDLLTSRGPVTELRSGNEPVLARVLSATPAPPQATPTDSQVNTRRVVVSRPIQTVQEVDVVEPFTKIERVAVHQPAVVKTAHVELAHVPAAVHAVTPVPLAAHAVTPIAHYY